MTNYLNAPGRGSSRSKIHNMTLLSTLGLSTIACNSTSDDQCFAGLGIIAGSFCASRNDIDTETNVPIVLEKFNSGGTYQLTTAIDLDGRPRVDTIEFTNDGNVSGTKHSLSSGDILKNPDKVSLNLVNSGAVDGQKIFGANEIELTTQGTTVVLATNWVNTDKIVIKDADQSVTLNDLQASKLDSAIADDNNYYPGTSYSIESVKAPSSNISFYFDEDAILGTSTELQLTVKGSNVSLIAGVFEDPTAVDDGAADGDENPFEVTADTDIEILNLVIDDSDGNGSQITDIFVDGLQYLNIFGGLEDNSFEILSPLDSTLVDIESSTVATNLKLDISESILQKIVNLGAGNDQLFVGGALVAAPGSDQINGGDGHDQLIVNFTEAETVSPNISSFEEIKLSFNGASVLDFSEIIGTEKLVFLDSSVDTNLQNVPYDLTDIHISGNQAGAWVASFEENAEATPNIIWVNNTGTQQGFTSLTFDEVRSLSLIADGESDTTINSILLDSDDTTLLTFTNTDDGNLSIATGTQIDTLDALTSISLTSTQGGDIRLGSVAGEFGIVDASKLSNITINASPTGEIEMGPIGSTSSAEDLQMISIVSQGADIKIGNINALNAGTFSGSISSSSTLSFGSINLNSAGESLSINGSGSLAPLVFLGEAFKVITLTDLISDANVSFANASEGIRFSGGSGNDTIVLGLGRDEITGNAGADIFEVGNGSSGVIETTADVITDFETGIDKLKLGVAGDQTSGTGNYVEGTEGVSNFSEALVAANLALSTLKGTSNSTEIFSFQYDSTSGYLFIDNDLDGSADDVLVLLGVENSTISSTDIIA